MKNKFILEFDEEPALVFVQISKSAAPEVYQDGKKLIGIKRITIDANIEYPTTHELEYLTGTTKSR